MSLILKQRIDQVGSNTAHVSASNHLEVTFVSPVGGPRVLAKPKVHGGSIPQPHTPITVDQSAVTCSWRAFRVVVNSNTEIELLIFTLGFR